jgi:sugar phosphate isomerase/epimerase
MPPILSIALAGVAEPPREAIERVARARLAGAAASAVQLSATKSGIRPRDLDTTARRGLREVLKRLELAVTGFDLWIPPGHFVDGAHVDRAVAAVEGAAALAADIAGEGSGRSVSLVLPTAPGNDVAKARFAEALAAIVAFADRFGVELVDYAVATGAQTGDAGARVRIGIDPAACFAAGVDPVTAVSRHGMRVGGARLVDLTLSVLRAPPAQQGDRAAAEDARLDLVSYATAISVAGDAIPVVVDPRGWTEPWSGIERAVRAWHAVA